MSTLDLSKPLPVDVSNFLRLLSILLDQVTDANGVAPEPLDEYNGIGMLQLNVRPFLVVEPFGSRFPF